MERLMRRLNGSLSRSVRRSVQDIFQQSPLDLRFALQKTLDPRVTHTRAGSAANAATFVDSSGVLQRAVTNLALRSEEFDNASWTQTALQAFGSGSIANAIAAPNGSITADLITENTASSEHNVLQATTVVASTTYTLSCYAKKGTRSILAMSPTSPGVSNYYTLFNLDTGVTVYNEVGNTPVITALGNGWYRCSITRATGAAQVSSNNKIGIANDSLSTTYTGNGTSGLYVWGAQLEQASTVGDYVPTTSAINSAPRFDHNPTTGESLGLLVEEARTNSVTNNTMVGAVAGTPGTNPTGWIYATTSSNGLTISIAGTGVENGINYIDYRFNGTTVASPNSCAIGFVNATAATGQTWTASMYWKLAGGSTTGVTNWQLGLIENTAGNSFVTGAFYSQTAPTSAALITQRPAATRTLSGGATVGLVAYPLSIIVSGNTAIDFTIRIGLPQLEQGAFATSVIPTTSATVTRAADVASIAGSNFGTTRTNLLLRSEAIATSPWFSSNVTLTNNTGDVLDPANGSTATKIVATGSSSSFAQSATLTATTYAGSIWLRCATGTISAQLIVYLGGSPFTNIGTTNVTITTSWQRFSVLTSTATAANYNIQLNNIGAGTIYAWGAQLETGSTATAYIPTTTAAVSVFESSWYNQTEGTVFAETQLQSIAARSAAGFDINDNSTNNRIVFRALTTSGGDQVVIRSGSSTVFSAAGVSPAPTTASRKSAVGYKVNDFMFTAVGSAGFTGTTGAVPVSVNQMLIGYEQGPTGQLGGTIKRLTYWPKRLADTTLQQITQP